MNPFEIFVRRPVATILISLGLFLTGAVAYFQLPVSPLPQVDAPVITVSASMAGASPEVMASTVATPLERHLGVIADVSSMQSTSSVGSTRIFLQFGLDRDLDGAARDVQAAINAARADLPAALRGMPSYLKVDTSLSPMLVLTLTSDSLTQGELYDDASTILQQPISQVPGVGYVWVGGSSLPAVRVEINPTALFARGISLENVRAALAGANANSPKGVIEDGRYHWQIYSNDQAETAADYRNLIIAYRRGAPVRLCDIANVLDSVEDVRNLGLANGRRAVVISISRQPGANIIDTVDRILAMLPHLQASIPSAAHVSVAMNFSTMIRSSVHDVELSLLLAVVLVVLVVFAFLGDWRATLIPGVALPLSIVGTFGAMYLLGYSLDTLSLIALTISTGFVVDDAIVVMENTVRRMEHGEPRFAAALASVREVGFTVVSMSVSLLAVFSPILFMGGIAGRFFHEFAATISVAIALSMLVSLATTPMMCARLLRPPAAEKGSSLGSGIQRLFGRLRDAYGRSLEWALDHRRLVLGLLLGALGLNFVLFGLLPKGFFPEEDTGMLMGWINGDQSISFQHMSGKLRQIVSLIEADPAVANVVGTTGGGSDNSGRLYISLKPLTQRHLSAEDVMTRLRPKLAQIPGATVYLQPSQYLGGGGGQQNNALYQYGLQSDDLELLRKWTPLLVEALKTEPALKDVSSDQQDHGLKANLVIDRNAASRLGLTSGEIDSTLYDAFGQRTVSAIYKSLNQYYVIMGVQSRFWTDPEALRNIYVSTVGGPASGTQLSNLAAGAVSLGRTGASAASVAADPVRNAALNSIAAIGRGGASTAQAVSTATASMIPLSAFAHYEMGTTPLAVDHNGQFVTANITFNLAKGAALSEAYRAIARQMNRIHVPEEIQGAFVGNAGEFQYIFGNLPLLLLGALLAIYVVLGILYESYAHPITILSTLPPAGVGALLALLLFNMEFDLISVMGIFLLIGIVKKNAIMMIDYAIDAERRQGLAPREAILKAGILRFRPILMTTLAALLGALPLAIGLGAGAEFRRPLGVAVIGGLILSQIMTLYTTPVVYLYIDRLRRWTLRSRERLGRLFRRRASGRPLGTLVPSAHVPGGEGGI